MLTKLTFSNKKTINTGNYENENPMASITVEFEQSQLPKDTVLSEFCDSQFEYMVSRVNALLKAEEEKIKNPKSPLSHHRVTVINGVSYPHVTSIITPITPLIPDIDKHGEVGTYLDQAFKSYIEEGVFALPQNDLSDKWLDMLKECVLKMGKRMDAIKDKIELKNHSIKIVNNEHVYCGEMDAEGKYEGEAAIFDCKKTKTLDKNMVEKYFMQISAYAKAYSKDVKCLVILSPYKDPVVTRETDKYFDMFLAKRAAYKEIYGI